MLFEPSLNPTSDRDLMDASSLKYIGTLISRNLISVLFPTFTVVTIFADLRRTARWKQQLAEQETH
ncbi:hypothetical protein ACFW04_002500 [Cataglyphis niger]